MPRRPPPPHSPPHPTPTLPPPPPTDTSQPVYPDPFPHPRRHPGTREEWRSTSRRGTLARQIRDRTAVPYLPVRPQRVSRALPPRSCGRSLAPVSPLRPVEVRLCPERIPSGAEAGAGSSSLAGSPVLRVRIRVPPAPL